MDGGAALAREPDPLEERRQSLINEIFQALPTAERFQQEWAARAKGFTPKGSWKAHDLENRTYAKYPHNQYTQTQGSYKDHMIELWPVGMWVLPSGKKVISDEELSQMRVKPNAEFVAVGMVHGQMRLLVSKQKNGPYEDLAVEHMRKLLPLNLNAIRCLLEGLAKPPKVAAGEPPWPEGVSRIGK